MSLALAESGLLVFPAVPGDSRVPDAYWPDTSDAQGFVDFAIRAGAPFAYAQQFCWSNDSIDQHRAVLEAGGAEGKDLLDELENRVGDLASAAVIFAIGGVHHCWHVQTDWIDDVNRQVDDLAEALKGSRRDLRSAQFDKIVKQLAHHPDFPSAKNEHSRLALLVETLPEAAGWHAEIWRPYLEAAKKIFQDEVLPAIEVALAEEGHVLVTSGMSKADAARTLNISDDRLRRLTIRHPALPKPRRTDG